MVGLLLLGGLQANPGLTPRSDLAAFGVFMNPQHARWDPNRHELINLQTEDQLEKELSKNDGLAIVAFICKYPQS